MIRVVLIAVLALTACGGVDQCSALTELTRIEDGFTEGEVGQALADLDRDRLTAALDTMGTEASEVREGLSLDSDLYDAADAFVRGANLLDATFSAETIREDDLNSALDMLSDGRASLRSARSGLEC